MIKLVASDLDGTLFNSKGQISDYGIQFVVATGRSYSGAQTVVDRLGLLQEGYGLICLNGLRTYHFPSLDYSQRHLLTYENCLELEALGKHFYLGILYCFDDMIYFEMNPRDYQDYTIALDRHNLRFFKENMATQDIADLREIKSRFEQGDPILKVVYVQSPAFMDLILERVRQAINPLFNLSLVGSGWAEVVFKDINKGIALREYGESLGIAADEIMAFGDAENDLEMLSSIPNGIVMANGMDSVKAIASAQAKSNDDDGVARYLVDYLGIDDSMD